MEGLASNNERKLNINPPSTNVEFYVLYEQPLQETIAELGCIKDHY
jgi:hypothetical protein